MSKIVNQLNVELQPEYRLNIPMSGFQAPVAASPSITTTDSNMVKNTVALKLANQ